MKDLKEFKKVSEAIKEVKDNVLRDYNEEADSKGKLSVSYSKMSLFQNCNRRYKFQYIDQMWDYSDSIATTFGTLLHAILELKGRDIMAGNKLDYDYYEELLYNGIDEQTDKHTEHILGVNEIKETYSEEWNTPDKHENTYDNKIQVFLNDVLPSRMNDDGWMVLDCEHPFCFVYDDTLIVRGFIDRIDYRVNEKGETEYRVVDYKSSKAAYREEDIKTSLQMFVYGLAILHEYGTLPIEYLYDFIAINETQLAMTKGYFKRGIRKINKFIDEESKSKEKEIFKPTPSPLCYYCPYSSTNPNNEKYGGVCEYCSKWTPENKTFEVVKSWDNSLDVHTLGNPPKKRKFVF